MFISIYVFFHKRIDLILKKQCYKNIWNDLTADSVKASTRIMNVRSLNSRSGSWNPRVNAQYEISATRGLSINTKPNFQTPTYLHAGVSVTPGYQRSDSVPAQS